MISIIIPTLNEEKSIEKTLKNLREISCFDYEIIVSDGNSQDKTVEIARNYADQVIVYTGSERQTIGGGRNLGAKAAKGEYLMFFDADCSIPDPNVFLKKIVSEFEKDRDLLAANSRLLVLRENETLADKIFSTIAINWPHYLYNNVFCTGSSSGEFQFIRKECFDKLGGYDEKIVLGEDNELFWRIAKIGRTKMFYDLKVYHTGRRFHKIGWPRIIWTWTINIIYLKFFRKSASKEWKPVR